MREGLQAEVLAVHGYDQFLPVVFPAQLLDEEGMEVEGFQVVTDARDVEQHRNSLRLGIRKRAGDQSTQFATLRPGTWRKWAMLRVISTALRPRAILAISRSARPILRRFFGLAQCRLACGHGVERNDQDLRQQLLSTRQPALRAQQLVAGSSFEQEIMPTAQQLNLGDDRRAHIGIDQLAQTGNHAGLSGV